MQPIPATILAGFLGAGRTTLLGRVLSEAHGRKIAVIENEFGAENTDTGILIADRDEQITRMTNGCICLLDPRGSAQTAQSCCAARGGLDMQRVGRKLVLQGVRQVMGSDLGPGRAPGEPRRSRMLFIGIEFPGRSRTRG